jgi:eukaryotic-like serine/threonine-protein kinase
MREDERALWRQADEALDHLLELPERERPSALASLELPAAVMGRVLELLEAAEGPSGPVDRPLADHLPAGEDERPDPMIGRVLGAFRLVERIGRGGMSVVYRAERHEGEFEQQVAVKVLHLPQLGTAGEPRFRREQQILARLRHPNIATLFDGSLTEEGTPYLVMELIDGERIDDHCQRQNLTVEERVELARQVCRAVGYAHTHLVVHRDIKPGNVLVDTQGRVKLLDFGIAKLLEDGSEELTRTHERAMTPAYAAPEQLRGEPVTTATDVYALGLLLYQLLVGEPAFSETGSLRDPDATPPAPSQVLGRRTTTPAFGAAQVHQIDRDLERIVMMALRVEPERRYPTAEDLARDLDRWRQKQPVMAAPDSLGYRLRKLAQRRRGGVAAAAVVLVVGAGGLAGTLWQAREARLQAAQAVKESQRATAARDFLADLFLANDPDLARGEAPTARELLDRGALRIQGAFAESPELRGEMLGLLGYMYLRIGEHEAARPLLAESLELGEKSGNLLETVRALHRLGQADNEAGSHGEALLALERAATLLASNGGMPSYEHGSLMVTLVDVLDGLGRRAEALERTEAALAVSRLDPGLAPEARFEYLFAAGSALLRMEQGERAAPLLLEAVSLETDFSERPSRLLPLHSELAQVAHKQGDLEQALHHRRAALAIAEELYVPVNVVRARLLSNLASTLDLLGRTAEALDALRAALEIYERVHPDGRHPRVAAAHNNLSLALMGLERFAEAKPHLARARALAGELLGRGDTRYAMTAANLGQLMGRLERFREAEELLTEAIAVYGGTVGLEHPLVGQAYGLFAELRLLEGRPAEALLFADRVLDLYQRVDHREPGARLAVLGYRARSLSLLGRHDEADATFAEALELIAEEGPTGGGRQVPRLMEAYAGALAARSDPGAAAAATRALAAHRETLGDAHPATARMAALAARLGAVEPAAPAPVSHAP